jgi:dTDP-4-dehydrorhamnose reductase
MTLGVLPVSQAPILVTGGSGQIGYELIRALAPLGPVVAPSSTELDLRDPEQIRRAIRAISPAIVVNAAAYTAVDRAEGEPDVCYAVNATAPGVLADEARRLDIAVVHYSTDYVFAGSADRPYSEADSPAPLNVYGASKLAGERAVAEACGVHLIFRTSWVYGARGTNFFRTIRRLARERTELRVVDDQRGAPTWSRAIAEATALVLARFTDRGRPTDALRARAGTYHLTAAGATTWREFASRIVEHARAREHIMVERVVPVTTEEFGAPAARPRSSVLDTSRAAAMLGVTLPDWQSQLALVLEDAAAT